MKQPMKTITLLNLFHEFRAMTAHMGCYCAAAGAVDFVESTAGHCRTKHDAWRAFCDSHAIDPDSNIRKHY